MSKDGKSLCKWMGTEVTNGLGTPAGSVEMAHKEYGS